MKIIVVGCGKIGETIIESLINEGHDVTAIDSDAQILNNICTVYDAIGVCGTAPTATRFSKRRQKKPTCSFRRRVRTNLICSAASWRKKWVLQTQLPAFAIPNTTTKALAF